MKGTLVKFRDNLLYQRQQRNMTQEQLAMLLGVSRQSVAKWEAGQSTPEVDKLLKMSELFGCSLDDLVNGDLTQLAVAPEEVLPSDVPPQDVCGYDEHTRKFSLRIAIGVLAIVLGVATTAMLEAVFGDSDALVVGFFIGVIVGLAFIIPAALEHSAFVKAHPFVEDFYTDQEKAQVRKVFARNLVVGIGIILVGMMVAAMADSYSAVLQPTMVAMIESCFLFFAAVGVFFIVHGSLLFGFVNVENYNKERANEKWERENPRVNKICAIIMLVATIIGLLLLFGGMAMSGSHNHLPFAMQFFWLAWVIGGILCAIVTVAMREGNVK